MHGRAIMRFRFFPALPFLFFMVPLAIPAEPAPAAKPKLPAGPPRLPVRQDALTLAPEIRSRIDAFFTVLKQRKVGEAYQRLFDGSVLAMENPDLVAKLIESTERVMGLTGRIEGAELLRIRGAGKTIREVTYLLNGEKRPLRWKFYFYLSNGGWQVLDTNVATEASGFFPEEK